MFYNIVTNGKVLNEIKKCRYFKINLGVASTMVDSRSKDRSLNTSDKFAISYVEKYHHLIYAQGNIGNIRFYMDYYIMSDFLLYYIGDDDYEEFKFDFDFKYVKNNSIENYLNTILKEAEDEYTRIKQLGIEREEHKRNMLKQAHTDKNGDPNKVLVNPGTATYEDVQAYIEQMKKKKMENL